MSLETSPRIVIDALLILTIIVTIFRVESAIANAEHVTESYDLTESFAMIGREPVVAAGHTGAGTAVAIIEGGQIDLDGTDANGDRYFGDCSDPQWIADLKQQHGASWWRYADHLGYAPEQGPGAACRVAWIQCINHTGAGYKQCDLPQFRSTHYTDTASVAARTAPGAKLVILRGGYWDPQKPRDVRAGLSFLLQSDYSNFDEFDSTVTPAQRDKWRLHWQQEFGAQSPVERFNIVAVNMSFTYLDDPTASSGVKLFSQTCSVNPGTVFDPDRYIDDFLIARDCPSCHGDTCIDESIAMGQELDLTQLFSDLRSAGVVPVVANTNRKDVLNAMSVPACFDGAMRISAVWDGHESLPPERTNIHGGTHPEFSTLLSPSPHKGEWAPGYPSDGAPSSPAAPMVAASIAILRSSGVAPDATPDELETYLQGSAVWIEQEKNCQGPPDTIYCPESPPFGYPVPDYFLPQFNLEMAVDLAMEMRNAPRDGIGSGRR